MKTLLKLVFICALPLAFVLGCGGDPAGPDDGTGNNPNPDCSGAECNETPPPDTGEWSASLRMTAPNGITGNFFMGRPTCKQVFEQEGTIGEGRDCALICENASTCNIAAPDFDEVQIVFIAPNHLFIPVDLAIFDPDTGEELVKNGATVDITWEPGSWAVAPNGNYSDENGDIVEVKTSIDGNRIKIDFGWLVDCLGIGLTCSGTSDHGRLIDARISDDLMSIEYHLETATESFAGTLTRME